MQRKNMRCSIESDPFNDYFAKIKDADGIVLGSPVYFSDITAGMKALIERCGLVWGIERMTRGLSRKWGLPSLPRARCKSCGQVTS